MIKISEKEKLLLNNLSSGMTISQIAKQYSYSEKQIRRYVKKLCDKFNVLTHCALCFKWGKIQHSSCFKQIDKN